MKSPSTRHINSSSEVSDPGIPMADLVYTLMPRNRAATPQYFMEAFDSGIW